MSSNDNDRHSDAPPSSSEEAATESEELLDESTVFDPEESKPAPKKPKSRFLRFVNKTCLVVTVLIGLPSLGVFGVLTGTIGRVNLPWLHDACDC